MELINYSLGILISTDVEEEEGRKVEKEEDKEETKNEKKRTPK